jgi:predicted O-methyltransferase YrrM
VSQLRGLPPRVAWFYFRASRRAIRAADAAALRAATGPESARHLLAVAAGAKSVVELGTAAGWSAIALTLADRDRRVTTFDPTPWPTRERYLQLMPAQARRRLTITEVEGALGAETFTTAPDLVFIDSSHHRTDTIASALAWRERLATDGLIVFHDYENESWPGVTEAIHELGLTGESPGGSLFVWRPE